MIRTATRDDLAALRALLSGANDEPYDLAAVAEEKCFGDGVSGATSVRMFGDEGASVTCGRYVRILAVHRDARNRGVGSALLADAEARGATVIAAEAGNYFTPGVSRSSTQAFLLARGYDEKAATWNLHVGLPVFESSSLRGGGGGEVSVSTTRRLDDSKTFRAQHSDAARVLEFVQREFGRIWRFEAAKAFATRIPQMFVTEERGAITGFAVHDVNNRGLGFFGPTGVDRTMRGRGLGGQLLLASLDDLRRLGYERAVIPWTDALDFYRKCSGAEPAHQFVAFEKSQS